MARGRGYAWRRMRMQQRQYRNKPTNSVGCLTMILLVVSVGLTIICVVLS